MKRVLLAALLLPPAALGAASRTGPERIVLSTPAGDMVLALYPEAAPRHAAKFLELARAGAYDGTKLLKVRLPVYLHFSGVGGRRAPLGPDQLRRIQVLKPAPGKAPAKTGALAMARDKDDTDETGTSFVILLADIPGMTSSYTVFGEVRSGMEVAWALANAPLDARGRPKARVEVTRALAVDSAKAVEKLALKPVDFAALLALPEEGGKTSPNNPAGALLAAAGLALFLMKTRVGPRAASLGLLLILSGYFVSFVAAAPAANRTPGSGLLLLVLGIGAFWLMGRFET